MAVTRARKSVSGFGRPVLTLADPRNRIVKDVAKRLATEAGSIKMFDIADRVETIMADAIKMFTNLDWFNAARAGYASPRSRHRHETGSVEGEDVPLQ